MTHATGTRAAKHAMPFFEPKITPLGWKCPVCEKGNAPWAATCGHCRRNKAPTYG